MGKKDDEGFDFDSLNVSPLRIAAVGLHEMFVEFRKAGFSRTEALRLVSDAMTASINDSTGK